MVKIAQILLGGGLWLVSVLAVAGPLIQAKPPAAADYPDCKDAVHRVPKATQDAQPRSRLAQDTSQENRSVAPNAAIDEYLSFHAQVTEDNGKFSLMPWSGLRTHAN